MIAERTRPGPVTAVEHHLLNLHRLRDEIDLQVDQRLRQLAGAPCPNRQVMLRRELAERRRVRRQVVDAMAVEEALLHRYRLLTEGVHAPLGVLIDLTRSPLTQEGRG